MTIDDWSDADRRHERPIANRSRRSVDLRPETHGRWLLLSRPASFSFCRAAAAPGSIDAPAWDELAARTVSGAYHIHTTRSDGHGDRAAVAAAAARAGLKFVILTDHGDGDASARSARVHRRRPGARRRRDQHRRRALRRARHAARAVSARRQPPRPSSRTSAGSAGSASPRIPIRRSRRCAGRSTARPIDGIEWLNTDSEWRDETRGTAGRAPALAYFLRPAPALASLFDRPTTLDRWDRAARRPRPVVALAASGRARRRRARAPRTRAGACRAWSASRATRRVSARSATASILDRPLSGDAAADARADLRRDPEGQRLLRDRRAGWAGVARLLRRGRSGAGRRWAACCRTTPTRRSSRAPSLPRGSRTGPPPRRPRGGDGARRRVRGTCHRGARGLPGRSPAPGGSRARRRCRGWCRTRSISAREGAEGAEGAERCQRCWCAELRRRRFRRFPWRIEKDPTSSAIASDRRARGVARVQARGRGAQQPVRRARQRSPAAGVQRDRAVAGGGPAAPGLGPDPARGRAAVGQVVLRRSRPGSVLRVPLSRSAADRRRRRVRDLVDRRHVAPLGARSRQRRSRPIRRPARSI